MNRWVALAVLIAMGAGWGFTTPLMKISVSEGYRHFGLIFWQFVIASGVLLILNGLRRKGLPCDARHIRLYAIIALIGTLLPNASSYEAARHLPAGIMAIIIATVPMFAFPLAIALGQDRFSWARFGGLVMGLTGVGLLVQPSALPSPELALVVLLALIAPAFYGLEGNVVAKFGTGDADALQTLLGASLVGIVLALPFVLATNSWITPRLPLTAPDVALIGSSVIHALVYSTYVWMIGRTGAVFASQVGYLVTGFGLFWSILILNESYAGPVWIAVAAILCGVALVTPKKRAT